MTRTNPFATIFVACAISLGACTSAAGNDPPPAGQPTASTPPPIVATTATSAPPASVASDDVTVTRGVSFTDDLSLDVLAPIGGDPLPVVVFFHGGSWYGGAKENVESFVRAMAGEGYVVFNATYRTGQQGGGYPQSYSDIGCAISAANALASVYGGDPDRVFVAGHSAGAQLSATVLFAGETFTSGDCSHEGAIAAAGFIGIAGPYDVTGFAALLSAWFGGTIAEIPDTFAAGGPFAYLDRPPVPVLLVHGAADELVPTDLTDGLADALDAAGWDVDVALVPGATHGGVIDPLESAGETLRAIDSFTGS